MALTPNPAGRINHNDCFMSFCLSMSFHLSMSSGDVQRQKWGNEVTDQEWGEKFVKVIGRGN